MRHAPDGSPLILVVQDVEETRDGLEKLLTGDGYRVEPARAEDDAVVRAQRTPPDLLLVNLGLPPAGVIAVAHHRCTKPWKFATRFLGGMRIPPSHQMH